MKNAKIRFLGSLFAVIFFSSHLFAQEYDLKQFAPLDPKVKSGTLPNGMKYFIRANKFPEKRADFYIAHNVGAIQEEDNQNGLAHFTEHMAFNGTKHFPKKTMLDYLATIGVKFGQNVNAGTGVENTTYMITSVPLLRDGILDSALLVLHDWSNFISFDDDEINSERGVIREEWRMYGSADERMNIKLYPVMYKDSKYAKRNVIGDTAVINNFAHETIRAFYHKWYRPDLQAVVIVGDFDADQVEAKVKKLFSDIPVVANATPKETYPIPDNKEPLIGTATDPEATSTEVGVFFKHEPIKDESKNLGYMRLRLEQRLINGMFSQRMTELTRKENPPFLYAYCYYGGYTRAKDAFTGYAQARNNESLIALKALITEMFRLQKFGFTAGEFDRIKADVLRSYESQYTDRDKRKNRELVYQNISYFQTNNPNPGIEYEYEFVKKMIPGITLAELNALAQNFVTENNMVITVTGPEKAGVTIPSEKEIKDVMGSIDLKKIEAYVDNMAGKKLIDKLPTAGKVMKVAKNEAMGTTEWTLSNGTQVIFKPTDFKDDELLISGFSVGGYSGLKDSDIPSAQLLSSVVGEMGIGEFSRTDLTKMMAGKRVNVFPYINGERDGISANLSPKDLETAMQLIHLYFTKPRWNDTDFKTFMDKMKNNYVNLQAEPRKVYSDSVNWTLNNHSKRFRPFTVDLLSEVSLEKVKAIYQDRFCDPGNFTFIITGKIDPEQAKPLIEKYLASLPTVKRTNVLKDDGVRPPKGKVTNDFMQENKTPRTSVYVNYNGTTQYSFDNILQMSVVRHALELRYIDAIREEKGGSYHVGVSFQIKQFPSPVYNLNMSFDTDPKLADDLKAIVHREIKKMVENGPTEADLQKAKEFFIKQRQEDMKENNWWSGYALYEYYVHKMDFLTDYDAKVKNLTVQSVKDFAAKSLTQGNVIEVVMRPK